MITDYKKYEDWISDTNNAEAVQAACVMTDYDPEGKVTANLIENWFFDWRIGWNDDDVFKKYFTRNIITFIPQYKELLRNQPGIGVELDNTVSMYRERELKTNNTSDGSTTYGGVTHVGGSEEDKNIRTGSQTTAGSDSGSNVRTGSESTSGSGLDTNVKTGSEKTSASGTGSNIRTGNETDEKSGSDSHIKTGGHTEQDVAGIHTTTTSPHVQRVTEHDNDTSGFSGNSSIQAALPMSKSYSTFIEPDDDAGTGTSGSQQYQHAYQHMPALDWSTASAQAQDGHREYGNDNGKTTESYVYGSGVEGDIVKTEGDEANPDTHEVVYNDETDETNYGSKDTRTYNNIKDEKADSSESTHTFNDITDTRNSSNSSEHIFNNVTDTRNNESENTLTYNSVTDTHTKDSNSDTTHTGTDTTNGKSTGINREIVAGRNEDPATLLARATSLIRTSNAWLWLRQQLEPCFMLNMEEY